MSLFDDIQQDPRFAELDFEQRKQALSLALDEDLSADPRFAELDPVKVAEVRDQYINDYLARGDGPEAPEKEYPKGPDVPYMPGEEPVEPMMGIEDPVQGVGFVDDTIGDIAGGIVDAAEMYGRAGRSLPGGDIAGEEGGGLSSRIVEWAKRIKEQNPSLDANPNREGFSRWFHEGVRSATTSLVTRAPATITGAIGGTFLGGLVGTFMGAMAGYATSGGTIFGLSEFDQTLEEAMSKGVPRDKALPAAIRSGIYEGGFEFLSDIITAGALGAGGKSLIATPASKDALKKGLATLFKAKLADRAKRAGAIALGEVSTEMATAGLQAREMQQLGIGDQDFLGGASRAFGPSLVASMIFFGLGEYGRSKVTSQIKNILNDPDADMAARAQAALQVYEAIKPIGKDVADGWMFTASEAIKQGDAIDLDTPVEVDEELLAKIEADKKLGEEAAKVEVLAQIETALYDNKTTPEEVRANIPGLAQNGVPAEQIEAVLQAYEQQPATPAENLKVAIADGNVTAEQIRANPSIAESFGVPAEQIESILQDSMAVDMEKAREEVKAQGGDSLDQANAAAKAQANRLARVKSLRERVARSRSGGAVWTWDTLQKPQAGVQPSRITEAPPLPYPVPEGRLPGKGQEIEGTPVSPEDRMTVTPKAPYWQERMDREAERLGGKVEPPTPEVEAKEPMGARTAKDRLAMELAGRKGRLREKGPEVAEEEKTSPAPDLEARGVEGEQTGYVFHRGEDPRSSTAPVVLAADDKDKITSYGEKEYAIPKSALADVPDWVQQYAENYYKDQYGDEYENFIPPNTNPDDIVNSADVWDDAGFVASLWQNNEDRLLGMRDSGIVGFKTNDGAVIFPGEDVPVEAFGEVEAEKSRIEPTKPPETPAPTPEVAPKPEVEATGEKGAVASIPESPDGNYQIYQASVKQPDGSRKQMFAVPSRERKTGRGFGDTLFDTVEEAQKEADLNRKRDAEAIKRKETEAREAEEEAKQKAKDEDLDGFDEGMPAFRRGRAISVLSKNVQYEGEIYSRRDLIRELVSEGRIVDERGLSDEDGNFLNEDALTKTGLDYARHLIEKTTPKQAVEVPETGEKDWFELGRDVNAALPRETGLKPSDEDIKTAADKLGISEADARRAWEVFIKSPEPDKSPKDKFISGLTTKGAARVGDIDYKILQADSGSFYYNKVKKGNRVTKGPVYPAKWSRAEAIDNALEDASRDLDIEDIAYARGKGDSEGADKSKEPAAPAAPETNIGTIDNINVPALADVFLGYIRSGQKRMNKISVKRLVAELLGVRMTELNRPNGYSHKVVEEAYEYAIVKRAREIIKEGGTDEEIYQKLKKVYENQPILGTRTSTSMDMQGYSTPVHLAFLAQRLAGVTDTTRNYEPTAGTGMLVSAGDPKNTWTNEIGETRLGILRDQGFHVTDLDATGTNPNIQKESIDSITSNPPFGSIQTERIEGYRISKLEHKIVMKALSRLKDNGKAAFIIGGTHFNSSGEMNINQRTFLNWLYANFNVVANLEIPGEEYSRQGAKFPVRLIAIHGRKKTPGGIAPFDKDSYRTVKSIDEILPILKEAEDGDKESMVPEETQGISQDKEGSGGVAARRPISPTDTGAVSESPRSESDSPVEEGSGLAGDSGNVPGAIGVVRTEGGRKEPGGRAVEHEGGRQVVGQPEPGSAVSTQAPDSGTTEEPSRDRPGRRSDLGERGRAIEGGPDAESGGVPGASDSTDAIINDLLDLSNQIYQEKAEEEGVTAQPSEAEPAEKPQAETTQKTGWDLVKEGISDFNEIFGEEGFIGIGEDIPDNDPKWIKAKAALDKMWQGLKQVYTDAKERAEVFIKQIYNQLGSRGKPYIDKFIRTTIRQDIEGETRKPPAPKKTSDEEAGGETSYQSVYKPKSKGVIIDETLIPRKMKDAVSKALDRLESQVGDIDEYVKGKLKYKNLESLHAVLSADQVDAVALAIYNVDRGSGMIIGDQTGVGKGRVAAAMYRYAVLNKNIPIFFTAKPELFSDFFRDIVDIDFSKSFSPLIVASDPKRASIQNADGEVVQKLLPKGKRDTALRDIQSSAGDSNVFQDFNGVLVTYSQINSPGNLQQRALSEIFPGNVAILDEAHKASGLESNIGVFMRGALSEVGGVTYLSATFAKRPDTMPLYYKTDLSRANLDMEALIEAVERGGVPLQETLSGYLAEVGQMIRREKSFAGIATDTYVDTKNRTRDESRSDGMTAGMREIFHFDEQFGDAFRRELSRARRRAQQSGGPIEVFGLEIPSGQADASGRVTSSVSRVNFASVAHNAVRQLLFSMKAETAVENALKELKEKSHPVKAADGTYNVVDQNGRVISKGLTRKQAEMSSAPNGRKVMIAVDQTMESFVQYLVEAGELQLDGPFDINYATILKKHLKRTLSVTVTDPQGDRRTVFVNPRNLPPRLRDLHQKTEEFIENMVSDIPASPIDYMKAELMKEGYRVEEITGREHVADLSDPDNWTLRRRPQMEKSAKKEILRAYNNGDLDVVIINRSGAEGVSAHASPQFKDQRPRTYLGVQPQLNVDDEVQLMGRINRKGQVALPKYVTLFLDIPAEIRPASVLMRKMKSLSANTSANADSPLAQRTFPDMMNRYGDQIVGQWVADHPSVAQDLDVHAEDGFVKISGRIAMQPVSIQREFFDEVEREFIELIEELKEQGLYDLEVQEFDFQARAIEKSLLTKGRDESHPLGASTYREKVSVINPTKPYKRKQIVEMLEKRNSREDVFQYNQEATDELRTRVNDYISEKEAQLADSERTYDPTPVNEALSVTLRALNLYRVGSTFRISAEGLPSMTGVLIDIRRDTSGAGNPAALSKTRFVFAVNNALRRLTVGLPAINRGATYLSTVENDVIEGWDQISSSQVRSERYIITGNLLQGFADAPDHSTIIRYTDSKGKWQQGILLPMSFSPSEQARGDRVRLTPELAVQVLGNGYPLQGDTIEITAAKQIIAPSSRQRGGPFFLDTQIRRTVEGGDFESVGNEMRAQIIPGEEQAAVERIYEIGETFSVDRAIYNEITGEGGEQEIRFSRHTPDKPTKGSKVKISKAADHPQAGKTGTVVGRFGANRDMVQIEGKGKFVVDTKDLQIVQKQKFERISEKENKSRVENYIKANQEALDKIGYRKAELGETFERVVWEPVGQGFLETNPLDTVSLPKGENVSALHVSNEAEKWGELLSDEYERGGRWRVVEIEAMPGDIIVEDVQQAMPSEMFGRTLDSGILVTGRETLKRRKDKIYFSEATSTEKPSAPVKASDLAQDVTRLVNRKFPGMKGLVKIVQSESDLPADTLNAIKREGMEGKYNGLHFKGKTYIVADNLSSRDAGRLQFLEALIGHEGRHWAFSQILGGERSRFMRRIAATYKDEVQAYMDKYDVDKAMAAEEVLASQVREGKTGALIDRFISKVMEWIRKVFPGLKVTKAEARNLIERAEALMAGEREAIGINQFAQPVRYKLKEAVKKITDNPAFVRWFGKSKVVDENGEPQTMYHGTAYDFNYFKHFINWFSNSPHLADAYALDRANRKNTKEIPAGESLIPVFLSAERPYEIAERPKHRDISRLLMEAVEQAQHNGFQFQNKGASDKLQAIKKHWENIGLDNSEMPVHEHWALSGDKGNELLVDFLEYLGFDSLAYNEGENRTIAVFHPTQIKSIYNTTFDPTNPDIRYQQAYHGTPHVWQPEPGFPHGRPRLDKIGSGEGGAAFGWGWYSAEAEEVGETYTDLQGVTQPRVYADGKRIPKNSLLAGVADDIRLNGEAIALIHAKNNGPEFVKAFNELKGKKITQKWDKIYEKGALYTLDIPDDVIPKLLDWDKPLPANHLKKIVAQAEKEGVEPWGDGKALDLTRNDITGNEIYQAIARHYQGIEQPSARSTENYKKDASGFLARAGIPGNKYLGQWSRTEGEGSHNYVIWDQDVLDRIALLERNGEKLDAIREEERVRYQRKTLIDTGDPEADAKAKEYLKKLRSLYTKSGKVNEPKAVRLIERYESLIKTLRDDKKDIYAKQAALETHIKKNLPPTERYKVLSYIKTIARPVTAAARQKRLTEAIKKVEAAHQRFEKKKAIAKVDRLLMKKRPKRSKKGVQHNRQMDAEGNRLVKMVRETRKLTKEEANEKTVDLLDKIDRGVELTQDQVNEITILQAFHDLENRSVQEAQAAAAMLDDIVNKGRSRWMEKEDARREKMQRLRDQFLEEVTGGKGLKTTDQERRELQKGFWRRAMDGLKSFDDMSQSFEMILDKLARGDKESETLKSPTTDYFRRKVLGATLNESAGVSAHQEMVRNKLIEIFGEKGLSKRLQRNTKIIDKTGVTRVADGKRYEIPLSQNQAYKLWQLFQQPSIQGEMERHGYDATTLRQVDKFLDPQVKKWAQWQLEEFYPQYRGGINDVYKELFYTDMPMIEGYSPTSRVYSHETTDEALLRETGGFVSNVLGSATKTRVENSRDFNIIDGDSVLFKHIVEMEHFKAWGQPMQEMRSVFGVEATRRAVRQYHGSTADRVLQGFINRFAMGGQDRALTLNTLDKLRANFTRSVIGGNPVVFLKQLASIPAYMMEIPTSAFIKGTAYALNHPTKVYKTLMQSDAMKARYKVGWERDVMLTMQRNTVKAMSKRQTLSDVLMLSTKLGDKLAILTGGWSVYDYHLQRLLKQGMSKEKAHEEALHQFDVATKRSQQAGDVMDISYLQSYGGSLGKMFTMFMTAPLSYYRNSAAALRNMASGRKGANLKRLIVSWALLQMLFQWVASGFDWEPEKQLRAALVGPLSGLFIIRDITDSMMGALVEGRPPFWSVGTPPPLTTIAPAARAMFHLHKGIEEGWDTEEFLKMVDNLAKTTGHLTGLPYQPVARVAKGMATAAAGETEHPVRRAIGYSERALERD